MKVTCNKPACPCGKGMTREYQCACTAPKGRHRFCPVCGSWLEVESARTVLDAQLEAEPERDDDEPAPARILPGQLKIGGL